MYYHRQMFSWTWHIDTISLAKSDCNIPKNALVINFYFPIFTVNKENFHKIFKYYSCYWKIWFFHVFSRTMKNFTCVYFIFNKFNKIACFTNRESIIYESHRIMVNETHTCCSCIHFPLYIPICYIWKYYIVKRHVLFENIKCWYHRRKRMKE